MYQRQAHYLKHMLFETKHDNAAEILKNQFVSIMSLGAPLLV
jgi:hypothetical protein